MRSKTVLLLCSAVVFAGLLILPANAQHRRQQQHFAPQQRFVPQQRYIQPRQHFVQPRQHVVPRQHFAHPQQRFANPQHRHFTPQQRFVPQQRHVMRQPHFSQQRMYAMRQHHLRNAHAPAFNRRTGMWGQRLGNRVAIAGLGIAAATYGYIWYSSPDYDGAAYIELPGIGAVEFEVDASYSSITDDLSSGDPDRVAAAVARIEANAIAQGLMAPPETQE